MQLEYERAILEVKLRHERNERSLALQRDFESLFETICQALSGESCSADRLGDRWVVSDFWFDDFVRLMVNAASNRPELWRRALEACARILAPSFVVARSGSARTLSRLNPDVSWRPPLGDVPVLEVDPGDPDQAVADVLAACAVTRAG